MSIPPISYRWNGEALVPSHQRVADRHLVIGERYTLIEHNDRSRLSHDHYFATLTEAYNNLPERVADQFLSFEHFRKTLLIRAGYCDERSIVAASKAEALRIAAFIKPMDEYAVVTVSGCVVTVYTAKSQSLRAMGKAVFQESKDRVLALAAELVGVSPHALAENAGMAA